MSSLGFGLAGGFEPNMSSWPPLRAKKKKNVRAWPPNHPHFAPWGWLATLIFLKNKKKKKKKLFCYIYIYF